ncbi:MAG: GntR family transcriptional regulator [Aestuariivita sp.]|nr:GntR family transcriptional regulator [Aestuariivita sp.]MCY4203574.1 GntR family transcriptional regulator [Aestuariivita sp.]MCY4288910.1 GntR family transcriptional regulator [Aestuariivita sp.]MCY4346151.1 GntR family transcriptional regulator [Aestuariivita sp.]
MSRGWKDVRDHIKRQILNSTYKPGDKFPRDKDIALELNCARSTVHRAMRSLADAGIVERRRKGGTFLKPEPVTRTTLSIPITRVEIEDRGYEYRHFLVSAKATKATPAIATRFGADKASRLLQIQALHLADNRPYVMEDRWISLDTVPEFVDVDLTQISANEWLVCNRPYSRCDVQISAHTITGEAGKFLEAAEGAATLVLERTTWIDDNPITHVTATHTPGYRLVTKG